MQACVMQGSARGVQTASAPHHHLLHPHRVLPHQNHCSHQTLCRRLRKFSGCWEPQKRFIGRARAPQLTLAATALDGHRAASIETGAQQVQQVQHAVDFCALAPLQCPSTDTLNRTGHITLGSHRRTGHSVKGPLAIARFTSFSPNLAT